MWYSQTGQPDPGETPFASMADILEKCSGCGAAFHEHDESQGDENAVEGQDTSPGYRPDWTRVRQAWLQDWARYQQARQSGAGASQPKTGKQRAQRVECHWHGVHRTPTRLELERLRKRGVLEGAAGEAALLTESLEPIQVSGSTLPMQGEKSEERVEESHQGEWTSKMAEFQAAATPCLTLEEAEAARRAKEEAERQAEEANVAPPKAPLCMRCHNLLNNNRHPGRRIFDVPAVPGSSTRGDSVPSDTLWGDAERDFFARNVRAKNGLIVLILDVTDFPGSWIPDLGALVPLSCPLIVALNKMDALPAGLQAQDATRLMSGAKTLALQTGFSTLVDVHLVSAKTGVGLAGLARTIVATAGALDGGRANVFMLGATNVGKSSVWNALHRVLALPQWAPVTASHEPGTTVGIMRLSLAKMQAKLRTLPPSKSPSSLPLSLHHNGHAGSPAAFDPPRHGSKAATGHLFDTPGVLVRANLANLLTFDELKLVTPRKPLSPNLFILTPGRSLFVGGLVRLDYVAGRGNLHVTLFCAAQLPIHVTALDKAEDIYARHLGRHRDGMLSPPCFLTAPTRSKGGSKHTDSADSAPLLDEPRMASFPPLQPVLRLDQLHLAHNCPAAREFVMTGVGWLALSGFVEDGVVDLFSVGGMGLSERSPPLLPFAVEAALSKKLDPRKRAFFPKALRTKHAPQRALFRQDDPPS